MQDERQVIVCATRGGEGSRALQFEAVRLAKADDAMLLFIYIVNYHELGDLEAGMIPDVEAELTWLGETLLLLAQKRAQNKGVSAEIAILVGSPLAEIGRFAREHNADLILLGAPRGTTANVFGDDEIERASHSLQEETGIPVEVVRPEAEHEHVAKAT
jgi:nucleotide-binding universal stress UspA family protein